MGNAIHEYFFKKNKEILTQSDVQDFFQLSAFDITGQQVQFQKLKQYKAILVVNVASQCGYTNSHYKQLSALYEELKDQQFQILAFPCNQFQNQETLCERDIEKFVKDKFKVQFMLFSKIQVNGVKPHPVFNYLRRNCQLHDPLTGQSGEIPWNFSKFLVDNQGIVRGFYPPTIEPKELVPIIKKMLQ